MGFCEALTIEDLQKKLDLQLVDVYTAIAQRYLTIEWDQLVSAAALVSRPNQPLKGLTLESILFSGRYGPLLAELALGIAPTDRILLAAGAAWRKSESLPHPFTVVGGFQAETPIRDLAEDESRVGVVWGRRARAPGQSYRNEQPTRLLNEEAK